MAGPGESPGLLQSLRSRLIDVYKIPVAFSLGFTAVPLVVVRALDLLNGAAAEVSGFAERGLLWHLRVASRRAHRPTWLSAADQARLIRLMSSAKGPA